MEVKKGEMNAEDRNSIINGIKSLSKEDKISLISYLFDDLKKLHNLSEKEILDQKELVIPIGAFDNDNLSSLEAIVKHLKENSRLRLSKIAKLLNRSIKTIWSTYHNSLKKMPSPFGLIPSNILIPASVFSNRSFSTLENLVGFVKDLGYTNHEVAKMLHLDDRTIWSVYDRVKKKRGMKIDSR